VLPEDPGESDDDCTPAVLAKLAALNEPDRVALACLKLSGGDPVKLQAAVDAALLDYRDVLAWAEYPRQMRLGPNAPADAVQRARRDDAEEYRRWRAENP
jgi:hypothetical protein